MITHAVLRAHQLRKIGHGQGWLVEREWLSDGRVMQRVNEGVPEPARDWKEIGRWHDLDDERRTTTEHGWEIDGSK